MSKSALAPSTAGRSIGNAPLRTTSMLIARSSGAAAGCPMIATVCPACTSTEYPTSARAHFSIRGSAMSTPRYRSVRELPVASLRIVVPGRNDGHSILSCNACRDRIGSTPLPAGEEIPLPPATRRRLQFWRRLQNVHTERSPCIRCRRIQPRDYLKIPLTESRTDTYPDDAQAVYSGSREESDGRLGDLAARAPARQDAIGEWKGVV